VDGQCISNCIPDCAGRDCGPDPVCDIICGYCPGNSQCLPDGQCQPVCDEIEIGFGQIAPNLMLVIDKSGSMRDPTSSGSGRTKIQDAIDALNMLLNEGDGSIRFGWIQFPADAECAPGTVSVPIGDNSVPQIRTMVNALAAEGGTPTGESLQAANADQAMHDELRGNFVLLMTDGMPTCPFGNGREVTPEDCALALQGVEDLYANAIETFVIGLGEDLNASNPELLNQMAEAGGRPRPGAIKYYQANSLAELQLVLQDISGTIIGCSFVLDIVPEYPAWLWVYFDGVSVPRDPNHVSGWDYDSDKNHIDFYGPACDQLRSGSVGTVNIIMGCAPPD
jgi:hypothetical protein